MVIVADRVHPEETTGMVTRSVDDRILNRVVTAMFAAPAGVRGVGAQLAIAARLVLGITACRHAGPAAQLPR
jgi:hypothetical protein